MEPHLTRLELPSAPCRPCYISAAARHRTCREGGAMALGSSGKPVRIAFLLVPRFSMMAFAAGVEPLRAANRLSGSPLFEWQLVSADGASVEASNGISVAAQGSLAELGRVDTLIVCAGLEAPEVERSVQVHHQLRRLARHG